MLLILRAEALSFFQGLTLKKIRNIILIKAINIEVKSMKILVVGSLNYDYTFLINEHPIKGETILASQMKTAFGGKGGNQAVACGRLGGHVCMIGAIGNDSIGGEMLENLKNNGVDIKGIRKLDGSSGMAVINVDSKFENTIVVNPGVNSLLTKEHIIESEELFNECDVVLTQLEIPIEVVNETINMAEKWGKKVILNPAPAQKIDDEILSKVYAITPNETELKILTECDNIEEGAKRLLSKGIRKVIVTMGSRGCLYIDGTLEKSYKAFKVNTVDPTAAGDTFNAALVVRMNDNMDEAIEFASKSAALTTTRIGAQNAIPFLRDVESFECV